MSNSFLQVPAPAQSSGTTVTKSFALACTPGSTLVAIFTVDPKNATASVSDPTNGTWTVDADITNTDNNARVIIASIHNTASSALTVTGTSGASNAGVLQIYELSGPPSSSYVDVAATLNNNANPSLTISALANDTIIAGLCAYPGGATSDSGYTKDFGPTAGFNVYHIGESIADAGAAGSKTLNWNGYTAIGPGSPAFAVVAYKSGGSPPPAVVVPINLLMQQQGWGQP